MFKKFLFLKFGNPSPMVVAVQHMKTGSPRSQWGNRGNRRKKREGYGGGIY